MHSTVYIISVSAEGEIGRKRSTEWLLMEHLHLSSPLGGGNDGDDDDGDDGGGDHDGDADDADDDDGADGDSQVDSVAFDGKPFLS